VKWKICAKFQRLHLDPAGVVHLVVGPEEFKLDVDLKRGDPLMVGSRSMSSSRATRE
jgi:hypothetical protein